jgi:hypothetical protein
MVSRSALVHYPVARTPTEVRQIDVLAHGEVAQTASSTDVRGKHSISLGVTLVRMPVMVLDVMNGAGVKLTRACMDGTVFATCSLDAQGSVNLSLAAIACVPWMYMQD